MKFHLQWLFPVSSSPFWLIKVNKLFFFCHVCHEWVMIKWFVFYSPCPWPMILQWLFPVFSSPFCLIKLNKLFFFVTFAMSGSWSSGLFLVLHVLDSWDYSLAATVFHGSLTLSAPRSTYKFSWLAYIYFLEKLVERICLQIKAFFFSDHSVNSLNLSTGLCIDFFGRKLILVTLGTSRVKRVL